MTNEEFEEMTRQARAARTVVLPAVWIHPGTEAELELGRNALNAIAEAVGAPEMTHDDVVAEVIALGLISLREKILKAATGGCGGL